MKRLMIGALALVLAGTAFGQIRALKHDNWGGNPNTWQMQRHREKLASLAGYPAGGPKVVFVGDSITHFWESYGSNQLEKYFSDGEMRMLNLGYGGDRTENVLWRLDEGGELDGYRAKVVLLMIGTNNTGHFPVAQEPPADTILGIRAILRLIRKKQPDAAIVLTAIFPRGRDVNDAARRRNETVNAEIRMFADGRHVFWCDMNEQFLTRDGLLSPAIFPDRLHPADKGYEIWYSAVKPYIDYALADGRLPVPPHRYAPFLRAEGLMMDESVPETPLSGIRYVKNDNWDDPWLDRLEADRNRISEAKGSFDVVLIGDSVPEDVRKANAGPGTLDLVVNEGLEHLQWRLENGVLDGYAAKKIIFSAGKCSLGFGVENVAKGRRKALETIARKQPKAEIVVLPCEVPKWGAFKPRDARPSVARPADFDAYWDGEVARFAKEVPLRPEVRLRTDLTNAVADIFEVSFAMNADGSRRLYGWLAFPKKSRPGARLPLYVEVPGAGYGSWTTDPAYSADEIQLKLTVYDFRPTPYSGLSRKSDFDAFVKRWTDRYHTPTYANAGWGASRGEVFFHDVWLTMNRAVDWTLETYAAKIDPKRVSYTGESQGGGSGFFLLAMNRHFTHGVLRVPAVTDTLGFLSGRKSGWPMPFENQPTAEAKARSLEIAPYFDATGFAPRIGVPVRVCLGTADVTCPWPNVSAAFNALGSKDKELLVGLGDDHGSNNNGQRQKMEQWRRAR